MYSLGRILKAPSGFSKGEPLATASARPKPKNPWGLRPLGFLAFGLALDVAEGLPLENPEGGLQYFLPREYIEYSRDLQRAPFTMIPPRPSIDFNSFYLTY